MDSLEKLEKYMETKYADYKYIPTEYKVPNKINIKPIKIGFKKEQVDEFNEFYCNHFLPCYKDDNYVWGKLKLTKKNALAQGQIPFCPSMTIINHGKDALEFIMHLEMVWYRIQLNVVFSDDDGISGRTAFRKFNEVCKDFGIDLSKYVVDEQTGLSIKNTIPKLPIRLCDESLKGVELSNLHHLDLNSSFLSGVAKKYPEIEPAISKIYNNRKSGDEETNKLYKAILTHSYGYFQSEYLKIDNVKTPYGLSELSKTAVEFNNRYIDELSVKLIKNGNKIIAYNTDGIWYTGNIYHDENEGTGLGKWKNDVINSHGIFRSCGAYQYVTYNGDYPTIKTVLRGTCDLEKIKPREEWSFGDIMLTGANVKKYKFEFEKGIITIGEEQ